MSSASGAQLASSLIWKSVTRQPPPTRQGIIPRDGTRDDGKRERDDGKSPDFEVNLGKVISTLREDYPRIFFDPPSFDIYTEEIELRDPVREGERLDGHIVVADNAMHRARRWFLGMYLPRFFGNPALARPRVCDFWTCHLFVCFYGKT